MRVVVGFYIILTTIDLTALWLSMKMFLMVLLV